MFYGRATPFAVMAITNLRFLILLLCRAEHLNSMQRNRPLCDRINCSCALLGSSVRSSLCSLCPPSLTIQVPGARTMAMDATTATSSPSINARLRCGTSKASARGARRGEIKSAGTARPVPQHRTVYCDGRHCRIAVRTRTGAAVYAGSAKTVIHLWRPSAARVAQNWRGDKDSRSAGDRRGLLSIDDRPPSDTEIWNKRSQRVTNQRLHGRAIAFIVKKGAGRLGFDVSAFGAHSLRSGLVTSAVKRGVSFPKICDQTRHKSIEMLRTYCRDAELFVGNAAAGLL